MAKDKKGFMLYADQIELFNQLPDETAGKLIKHIFGYVNDENPETDDIIIKIAFTPIKQQLKRDLKKWEKAAENSRINGAKGGRPKIPKNPVGYLETQTNPDYPRKPVKVNVTVKDNVKDTVKDNKINKKPPKIKISGEDKELKKDIKKPDTLFKSFRKKFEEKYESITESEYYWAIKDSVAINQLIKKVNHAYKTSHLKPVENPTDEQMIFGFEHILNRAAEDKWICTNFEPGIINSKFNNLKINETTSKNDWSSKVMRMGQGLIDLEEQLRNDS